MEQTVSPNSDYESGKLRICVEGMLILAKFYNASMDYICGIRADNAREYLDRGASHVIVTSYVFRDGQIAYENLEKIKREVGREHLVLDLSCRKKDGEYYVVTDRWQRFTDTKVTLPLLRELGKSCAQFLVHAVDVEGKAAGIDGELVGLLAAYKECPVTYAGGVGSFEDLEKLRQAGQGRVDVTIGSALDIFGGSMQFDRIVERCSPKPHKNM